MCMGHIQSFLSPLLPLSPLYLVANRPRGKEDPHNISSEVRIFYARAVSGWVWVAMNFQHAFFPFLQQSCWHLGRIFSIIPVNSMVTLQARATGLLGASFPQGPRDTY